MCAHLAEGLSSCRPEAHVDVRRSDGGGRHEPGCCERRCRHARQEEPHDDARGRAGARDRADVLRRPHPRRCLAPRHRSRVECDPRRAARGARRARDRIHDLPLRQEVRRRRRGLRVPHARRPPVGRRLLRGLLLRRRPLPRRRWHLPRAQRADRRVLDDAHLRQRPGLVGLGDGRSRDRPRPQLLRRPPCDSRHADLRDRLVHPDADPGLRDHRQGREGRQHAVDVRPEQDLGLRHHRRRRARRHPARHPPLRRLRGGRLDRRGVGGSASLDPSCPDRHRRRRGGLLRLHVLRVLGRLRREGGERGRLGVLSRPGQRDGHHLRRLVVRDPARAGRHPRRHGASARDLCDDRARILRPRPRRLAAVVLRQDVTS